jgi:hypothetical protein
MAQKNIQMKKLAKIFIAFALFGATFSMVGCDGLLNVDSDRIVMQNQYNFKSANDTLYSMFGILSQLEKLADSYVLIGELRGDLMDVTPNSNIYLKEIDNFNISDSNPYANNIKDYYAVINNCNYVIHNIDTTVMKGGLKVMLKEYSAAKAIRAWTYLQIVLNYGSAHYYVNPILTVADANAAQNQTPLTLEQIAPLLIQDLLPFQNVPNPDLGSLYSHNLSNSFFPVRFVLGDLYLWTGQYENAATEYHDLMFNNYYLITSGYQSRRLATNNAFNGTIYNNWPNLFSAGSSEYITSIAAANVYGKFFELDSMNFDHSIVASAVAKHNWASQMYYYSNVLDTLGDLRALGSWGRSIVLRNGAYYLSDSIIVKDYFMNQNTNKQVMPYRVALLYLRYAEAVNRLNKPNLALAVLKYGMNRVTLGNSKAIPKSEIPSPIPNYMNFQDTRFDNNIGIRMRGCGNVNQDTTYYIIPKLNMLSDSVLYVEDLIQKELALETACEGNRFQDLMRFAIRRDDNSYLANIVASKYSDNREAIRTKLMDRKNWYLKP